MFCLYWFSDTVNKILKKNFSKVIVRSLEIPPCSGNGLNRIVLKSVPLFVVQTIKLHDTKASPLFFHRKNISPGEAPYSEKKSGHRSHHIIGKINCKNNEDAPYSTNSCNVKMILVALEVWAIIQVNNTNNTNW